MLPKNLRFSYRAHPEFFNESRWVNLPGSKTNPLLRSLSFRVQPRVQPKEGAGLRWAVVVPKKVGNAVQRAKIKRLVRHAIIALFQQQPQNFDPAYNVVVFVRAPLSTQQDAEQILQAFLAKL